MVLKRNGHGVTNVRKWTAQMPIAPHTTVWCWRVTVRATLMVLYERERVTVMV
jgi:hypothetical protein